MSMCGRPLKVGLILDDLTVPSWIASIVADIQASPTTEIAVMAVLTKKDQSRVRSLSNSKANAIIAGIGRLYVRLDDLLFDSEPNALTPFDLQGTVNPSTIIEPEPLFAGTYFHLNEIEMARLKECDIDVLLLLCSLLPEAQMASLARYGIWSFLDQERIAAGQVPTGFWEVLEQHPVMKQSLRAQLPNSPHPVILHDYYGPSDLRSIKRARNNYLWKSSNFVRRKLHALQETGSFDAIAAVAERDQSHEPQASMSQKILLPSILSHGSRFVRDRMKYYWYMDQWVLAYKFEAGDRLVNNDLSGYGWIIPPRDRFWADPFPVKQGNEYFLFFEECFYSNNKGHICVAPIDENGFRKNPEIILQCDLHLSYPFVFSWEGRWYLIPESEEANRIDVYKFDSFPYHLSFHKTLVDNVKAVDTTLCEVDGHWWMFAGMATNGTPNVDEVFLFHADNPFGPWVPHTQNPIKSDVRSARPAGNVILWQSKRYRPAQDCSHGYGYGVRFHEIKTMCAAAYQETEVATLLPDCSQELEGIHTFNRAGDLTVIDARRWRSRWQ